VIHQTTYIDAAAPTIMNINMAVIVYHALSVGIAECRPNAPAQGHNPARPIATVRPTDLHAYMYLNIKHVIRECLICIENKEAT